MDDDLHLSRIQTAWSMVRQAHGDHTAVQAAQQSLLDRYGGAVRRYALAALRDEDAADEVFQEFALKFVRGDFGKVDPERGRFRAFVKTVVYRLIVDYQRRQKKRAAGRPDALEHRRAGRRRRAMRPGDDAAFQLSWRDELLARCWQKLADDEKQSGKPYHTVLAYRVDHPDDALARAGRRTCRRSSASRSMPARFACCCIARATRSPNCCSTKSSIAGRRIARRCGRGADRARLARILPAGAGPPPRKVVASVAPSAVASHRAERRSYKELIERARYTTHLLAVRRGASHVLQCAMSRDDRNIRDSAGAGV